MHAVFSSGNKSPYHSPPFLLEQTSPQDNRTDRTMRSPDRRGERSTNDLARERPRCHPQSLNISLLSLRGADGNVSIYALLTLPPLLTYTSLADAQYAREDSLGQLDLLNDEYSRPAWGKTRRLGPRRRIIEEAPPSSPEPEPRPPVSSWGRWEREYLCFTHITAFTDLYFPS